MNADTIRNVLLVAIVVAVVWLGYRFVTSATDFTEGTSDVLEVDLLPETASVKALELAEGCDAGDGADCALLRTYMERGKEGMRMSKPALIRLCRKACERGDKAACDEWGSGESKYCPMGND